MPLNLPDHGLSLYPIPKNGSTTLWMWGYLLRKGEECTENIYDNDWMYDGDSEAITMTVRRDPVDRFISGYRNSRDKRGLTLGFSEFVKRLPELMEADSSVAHHFKAQYEFFPEKPLRDHDYVFDFNDFNAIRAFLEHFTKTKLPDYHEQRSYFDDFTVSDEDLETIQNYYLNDYFEGFGELKDERNDSNGQPSKRLVTTAVIGKLDYQADRIVPSMRAYAKRLGADFELRTEFSEKSDYGNCPYYVAVDSIRKFTEQTQYEELLFLDADVLVLPDSPDIFGELGQDGVAVAADLYHKTQDTHFKDWLLENGQPLNAYTEGSPYYNSGVMVFRRAAAQTLNFDGPYPSCPWFDQDWLNLRLAQSGLRVKPLDRVWNFWPEGKVLADLEKGNFIHFVGPRKHLIGTYEARVATGQGDRNARVTYDEGRKFLILCREPDLKTKVLKAVLSKFGEVLVISDRLSEEERGMFYEDSLMNGFELMNYFGDQRKAVTAWERAWKHLSETVGDSVKPVWVVEDDVAGSEEYWEELIVSTEEVNADFSAFEIRTWEDDQHWEHWGLAAGYFNQLARSFNPLCRLSPRLIMAVLEFRRQHGRFCFLEVIFASLVREHGMSFFDWKKDELLESITTEFRYRPNVTSFERGLCHPVKNEELHREICGEGAHKRT